MTPKGRLAVAAAEQAGRVLGARAACSALRSLVLTLSDPNDRVAALLAAARHACALRDEPALFALARLLEVIHEADARAHRVELAQLCGRLLREHRPGLAVELARAELQRQPGPHAHYLLGRCLHADHPRDADAAYREADASGDASLGAAARHQRRLLALRRRVPATVSPAAGTGAAAVPGLSATDDPAQRIGDAAARLLEGGRYARALAIDDLASLAGDAALTPALRHTALRLLARHVDAQGPRLSEVEQERLRAAFASAGPRVAATLAACCGAASPSPHALALDAPRSGAESIATSLDAAAYGEASAALRRARTELPLEDAPASLYAAAWRAALEPDPEAALEGSLLLDALLRTNTRAPRAGFLALSRALRGRYPGLADLALERAAERREPGALDSLGKALVAEACKAYARGDRDGALSALRRADRLSTEATGARPPASTTAPPAGPGAASPDERRAAS